MEPQPHTGSYYAATANDLPRYPRLEDGQRADVCVIGAGFTGISTALSLAERGYKVHVVEAHRVGWGASGRNGGQLIGGISGEKRIAGAAGSDGERMIWDMRWAGHQIIRDRVARYSIDCDLKHGYVDVAIKKRHLRALEDECEWLAKFNFPDAYDLLDANQIAELIGTKAYIGALRNMGNGHLHPLNLCIGEAKAAAKLGVRIFERSEVVKIRKSDPAVVVTGHGSVTTDYVVLAGNAYHFIEPKLLGIMFPVNSFIIATEPLSNTLVNQINPADLAVCDPNYVLEYFRLSADRRLLFGGRCNYFGSDPEVIKRHLVPRMSRVYPELANVRVDFAWGGSIGVPINRVPQMGRLAGNVFYSQGYCGHGVNVTHLAGEILADVITGTSERFDLFANIKPIVMPGAYRFRKPLVALGVLYYQIKDKL